MTEFELDAFLPYRLSVLAGRVSRSFAERYRSQFGLSVAEWRVMAHLSQSDHVSVRDLHLRADLEKSKASRAAARLEAAGLIAKKAGDGDRRLVSLTLTDKGRDMMSELIPLACLFETDLVSRLSPQDHRALDRIINDLLKIGD